MKILVYIFTWLGINVPASLLISIAFPNNPEVCVLLEFLLGFVTGTIWFTHYIKLR